MAAPRRSRSGVAAGALALAGALGLAAHPVLALGAGAAYAALPGLLSVALLGVAFAFRVAPLIPWALAPLLVAYGVFLVLEGEDPFAPAVAGGLILVAELAYWAVEPSTVGRGAALVGRRAATLVVLAAGAGVVATFLLGAAGARPAGGPAISALGVIAAVGAVAIVVWLARAAHPR